MYTWTELKSQDKLFVSFCSNYFTFIILFDVPITCFCVSLQKMRKINFIFYRYCYIVWLKRNILFDVIVRICFIARKQHQSLKCFHNKFSPRTRSLSICKIKKIFTLKVCSECCEWRTKTG
jgi:hypothetical protein